MSTASSSSRSTRKVSFTLYSTEDLIRRVTAGQLDLQARDIGGKTILNHAVRRGQVQLVEQLLEKGADVNIADKDGRTALLVAASSSRAEELLPLLMRYRSDVSVVDRFGENVLHILAFNKVEHIELARAFIEMGVSVHARNSYDYQPIHWAACWGRMELIKLYLDHGANVNSRAGDGKSPLYFAAASNQSLKTLLHRGADVHPKTIHQARTALHLACCYSNEENIRLLLAAGADVLAETHNGCTPFEHIKLRHRNIEKPSVRLMLKALALEKAGLEGSIELKDERIIREYPKLWEYFRDCHERASRMKSARFNERCTLLDLLRKRHDWIAPLIHNPEFEVNFEKCDLAEFSMYAEDVRRAFELVQCHYRFMLEREDVINEAVYYILPEMVVRRVIRYSCNCFEKHVN